MTKQLGETPTNRSELTPAERDDALAFGVERLLRFGLRHALIKKMDVLVARNTLLDLLNLAAPYEGKVPKEDLDTPTVILDVPANVPGCYMLPGRHYEYKVSGVIDIDLNI